MTAKQVALELGTAVCGVASRGTVPVWLAALGAQGPARTRYATLPRCGRHPTPCTTSDVGQGLAPQNAQRCKQ